MGHGGERWRCLLAEPGSSLGSAVDRLAQNKVLQQRAMVRPGERVVDRKAERDDNSIEADGQLHGERGLFTVGTGGGPPGERARTQGQHRKATAEGTEDIHQGVPVEQVRGPGLVLDEQSVR
ncbi:hypothetical protein [Frankia tisae]|uniref:hypothetical protein n=1 Tax=Frankia tisae TaxID=2950104 RepID=UPI0021C1BF8F|nr:hypothetical protein [Frankia tisae]